MNYRTLLSVSVSIRFEFLAFRENVTRAYFDIRSYT